MANKEVLDSASFQRALTRITYEIIEKNKGAQNIILVGVKTRGEYLARRIAARMAQLEGQEIPVTTIDVSHYRDDIEESKREIIFDNPDNLDINDKPMVLVDDVLYTGRTIRAALDALLHIGRPKSIRLATLVDRGHRELPIAADFVGKIIPTANTERICVRVKEIDEFDSVEIER